MKKLTFLLIALFSSSLALQSCSSDDDGIKPEEIGDYSNGIFVLNEGAMGSNNAEVTYFKNGIATPNIFKTVNPHQNLGNVATSITFEDNVGYIVVNMSNKIEVVNAATFASQGTITSHLDNPRYAAVDDQNLYVTNWGDASNPNDDYIAVYKRSDLSFVKKIEVAEGPEQLLIENDKVVIAHAGGWSNGNSISIYNINSNSLENITVGDIPNALVEEDGMVYVLCSGITWGGTSSAGKLVQLNLANNRITKTIDFEAGQNPRFLVEENDQLYYTLNNGVYRVGTQATILPTTPLFTSNASYIYSFNIIGSQIYIGDAKDFASNGEVHYYNLAGNRIGSFSTGIGPNMISEN